MRGDLSALRAFEQTARRVYANARGVAQRTAVLTSQAVKSGVLGALERIETALLSPSGRERIHASVTFAFIFLFAVTSVDFLIVGGAEFGAPERAAAQRRSPIYASSDMAVNRDGAGAPLPAQVEPPMPTEIAAALADATGADVTALSQSFDAPSGQARVSPGANEASQSSHAPLAGETSTAATPSEQSATEAGHPAKDHPEYPRRKAS